MTTDFETGLRALIAEVVREELPKPEAPRPDEYLSVQVAAKLASVADDTLRRWVREGKLAGFHAGRVTRIRRADLEKLLRDGPRRSDDHLSPEALARRDFTARR